MSNRQNIDLQKPASNQKLKTKSTICIECDQTAWRDLRPCTERKRTNWKL